MVLRRLTKRFSGRAGDEASVPAVPPGEVPPIICYQMGKVGSVSVETGLRAALQARGIEPHLFHVHSLNKLDEQMDWARRTLHEPSLLVQTLQGWGDIRRALDENPEWHWDVISLVREPVARNISHFFESMEGYLPDWQRQYEVGQIGPQALQEIFFRQFDGHWTTMSWFDNEMQPVFGIDVYSRPFPKEQGFAIYNDNPHRPLLLLRLEDLARVAAKAVRQFLGLKGFRLPRLNTAQDKAYREAYDAFVRLPLPATYVDDMYGSWYSHHFYSREELRRFRSRWTGRDAGWRVPHHDDGEVQTDRFAYRSYTPKVLEGFRKRWTGEAPVDEKSQN